VMGFGYGMMGRFGGFGWMGWIFQLIILLAIVMLVVYAVRSFSRKAHVSSSSDAALQILAERFARGEISAETYRSMKENLK
jgi:uncharacterized membrane protein